MKRSALFAFCLSLAVALAGCTGHKVAEEDLPTRVPELDAEVLLIAARTARPTARPTATDTPVPPASTPQPAPTDTPLPPVPESELTATPLPPDANPGQTSEAGTAETGAAEQTSGEPSEGTDEDPAPDTASDTQSKSDTEASTESEQANQASAETDAGTEFGQDEVDPLFAGMPASLIAAMAGADPDRGETLTLSTGCTGCHSLDPNQFMAGPTWNNLAQNASERMEGQSPGFYLYNSIVDPNAYLVENFQPNIMLQTYGETLPESDLADIIAYLLTIRGR